MQQFLEVFDVRWPWPLTFSAVNWHCSYLCRRERLYKFWCLNIFFCFCARTHMLSQFCPSVCPSVCLSVTTRVIHAKMVVVRIVQFSPYSSPIPLVFARWVSSRNSKGLNGGVKQGWGRKNSQFSPNNSRISEMVQYRTKVTIND